MPPTNIRTIGEVLNEKNISWAYYGGAYNAAVNLQYNPESTGSGGVWKDLESANVMNKHVLEGGKYSINIRIIEEISSPLVDAASADLEGSAVAVTGGKLLDPKKRPDVDEIAGSSIEGGTEQTFMPGDILYIPPGVPHGFKNIKGFRAYLIRLNMK